MSDKTQDEYAAYGNDYPKDEGVENPAESAEQLRAEIEETRAEMSETIDAIQEKLDPQHIKEQVIGKVHDATIGRAKHLAQVAGEKLSPATAKLEGASQKLGEIAEQKAQTAREKGVDLQSLLHQKTWGIGGIAVAVVVVGWFLFFRDDEE